MRKDYDSDALYRDVGCNLRPKCLTCPLPQCKYDFELTRKTAKVAEREAHIRQFRQDGYTVAQIAFMVKVSDRMVQRILAVVK